MTRPPTDPAAEIRAIARLGTPELRLRYEAAVGKPTRSSNGAWLRQVVARHAAAEVLRGTRGPERRRIRRALQDVLAGKGAPKKPGFVTHDPRIPPVGSVLRRRHAGQEIEVSVTRTGFRFCGRHYPSLTAIAREVTGARWNGFLWFGLTGRKRGRRPRQGAA